MLAGIDAGVGTSAGIGAGGRMSIFGASTRGSSCVATSAAADAGMGIAAGLPQSVAALVSRLGAAACAIGAAAARIRGTAGCADPSAFCIGGGVAGIDGVLATGAAGRSATLQGVAPAVARTAVRAPTACRPAPACSERESPPMAPKPREYLHWSFGSDSIAVRVTRRIGSGYPHPTAMVKVVSGGS